MCIGCHGIPGYKASFPESFQVPMIGGQSAKFIEGALKAYQKGERKHPSMKGIAASLCFACHGKDFNSPIDPTYPKLAGQHKDYLEHALTAYKRGDAANGRNNAIMGGQVKALSDQDIRDIAAYLHSLPGSLVSRR
eukprot:gene7980-7808_t